MPKTPAWFAEDGDGGTWAALSPFVRESLCLPTAACSYFDRKEHGIQTNLSFLFIILMHDS